MKNKRNLWIIPTDKPSKLHIAKNGDLHYSYHNVLHFTSSNDKPYSIYITSDEKLKKEIWCINLAHKVIVKPTDAEWANSNSNNLKKIILTTDQELIKDGVQEIPDEFLEWFVKNPNYESVKTHVVELCTNCGQQYCDNRDCRGYNDEPEYLISYPENTTQRIITYCDGYEVNTEKIIIPKEEPKQDIPTFEIILDEENHIQETLEVASLKFSNKFLNNGDNSEFEAQAALLGFIEGAKWNSERSYSAEELKSAFKIGFNIGYGSPVQELDLKNEHCENWFNQFKKK